MAKTGKHFVLVMCLGWLCPHWWVHYGSILIIWVMENSLNFYPVLYNKRFWTLCLPVAVECGFSPLHCPMASNAELPTSLVIGAYHARFC